MSNSNDGHDSIEKLPHTVAQGTDAAAKDGVVQNDKQQAVLNNALKSDPNKIPDGDSVGQHLAALKPGMSLE